jgi:hypothetical protein
MEPRTPQNFKRHSLLMLAAHPFTFWKKDKRQGKKRAAKNVILSAA